MMNRSKALAIYILAVIIAFVISYNEVMKMDISESQVVTEEPTTLYDEGLLERKLAKPKPQQTEQSDFSTGMIFSITGYCPCFSCCGEYAYSHPQDENGNYIPHGASGQRLISGYSCATSGLPFGTIVEIEGLGEFRVDDRGTPYGHLDLYFATHEEACAIGYRRCRVIIKEGYYDDSARLSALESVQSTMPQRY